MLPYKDTIMQSKTLGELHSQKHLQATHNRFHTQTYSFFSLFLRHKQTLTLNQANYHQIVPYQSYPIKWIESSLKAIDITKDTQQTFIWPAIIISRLIQIPSKLNPHPRMSFWVFLASPLRHWFKLLRH